MKRERSIWILFSSRKGGHIYPSRALYDYIKNFSANHFSPEIINLLDLSPTVSFIDKLGRYGDLKLQWLYKSSYQNLEQNNQLFLGSYRLAEGLLFNQSKIYEKLLLRFGKPGIIVSLQPEVNVIAHQFKNWFTVPIHTVIIDLAVHGLWVNRWIDHYYVANEPLKKALRKYRIRTEKITVAGMPLRTGFSRVVKSSIKQVKKHLNIAPDLPTILIMGGLLGTMIDFHASIQSITEMELPYQLLVVFGKNEEARTKAEALKQKSRYPIHFFGTVSNVDEMMWASDVIVSKPGSVTIAEALSLGKPMVVITPRAGSAQEHRFATFLKENGAGDWIGDAKDLGASVSRIFKSKGTYESMNKKAYELGHHSLRATETILNNIKSVLQNTEHAESARRTQKII